MQTLPFGSVMQVTAVGRFVVHHERWRAHAGECEAHRLMQVVDVH